MRKKVLFLIPTLSGGGAERVLVDLVNSLDSEKYELCIETILDGGVYAPLLSSTIKHKSIIKCRNKFLRKAEAFLVQFVIPPQLVYKWFIEDDYDVEIAYLEGTPVKLLSASSNEKAKKYTWVHIDLLNYYIGKKAFRNEQENIACYSKFDRVFCVSEDVRQAFIKRFGIKENVFVQYNVLDDKEIRRKAMLHGELKRNEAMQLISIGRLCHQKGYERLIRVVQKLNKNGFTCELHIFGDGEDREKLETQIDNLCIRNYVTIHGFTDNPYSNISAADIFVCSSYAEGFSTVATEALILGKAIVTTECSGMMDLLGNSEYGLIVDNSEIGLYEGLSRMIQSRELVCYYEGKAMERAEYFRKENRIREYEMILDSNS